MISTKEQLQCFSKRGIDILLMVLVYCLLFLICYVHRIESVPEPTETDNAIILMRYTKSLIPSPTVAILASIGIYTRYTL